jgi:hypothetical protein
MAIFRVLKTYSFNNLKIAIMKKFVLLIILLLGLKGYSQDSELFDREWHLHYSILDGEEFNPPQSFSAQAHFQLDRIIVYHILCGSMDSDIEYQSNNGFTLIGSPTYTHGDCSDPDLIDFMVKHYSIYHIVGQDIAKNPFNYTIDSDGDNYMLTIENGEGDIAVYGSVPLSQPEFSQPQLTLYPNPVTDVLHINSTEIINEVSVFDIHGKVVKSIDVNSQSIEINVTHLPAGMYFVKTQTLENHVITQRFLKK